MILVTGATNFVGRAVVGRLAEARREIRCLLQPSRHEQRLPMGVTFSTASSSLSDLTGLRAAMRDVEAVVHLTREEDPHEVGALEDHAQGTANVVQAAREAGVPRFIYLSRLGANQASAYPLFRAKGQAEIAVQESGLDYTILQAAIIYGQEDALTNMLVMLAKMMPLLLPIPGTGMVRFQPLWVEDLATCVAATLDRGDLVGRTIPLGGPEHFTLEQMVAQVMEAAGVRRRLFRLGMPLMRAGIGILDGLVVRDPTPSWWLDLAAVGSATALGVIPRHFAFEPSRFARRLTYLRHKRPWRRDFIRYVMDLG